MKIAVKFLLALFMVVSPVWAATDICDLLDLANCSGVT
jgi:hypothetical protein